MKAESRPEEIYVTVKSILKENMNFPKDATTPLQHHQQERVRTSFSSSSSFCSSSSSSSHSCSSCCDDAAPVDAHILPISPTASFSSTASSNSTNCTDSPSPSTITSFPPNTNGDGSGVSNDTSICSIRGVREGEGDRVRDIHTGSSSASSSTVKFHSIEIRCYKVTLGDNPSCSYGPPVTLDWEYDASVEMSVDEYEESRSIRRKPYQMLMNSQYRTKLLREWNISEDEIGYRAKELKSIKKGRERTKMMLPFWKIEDAAESMKRKYKRVVT